MQPVLSKLQDHKKISLLLALILKFCIQTQSVLAQEKFPGIVPEEIESSGGHSLSLGNGGMAALVGLGSVRMNPAMLPFEPQYTISAGYHWPRVGRSFYQVGAVDSTTKVSAGILVSSAFTPYIGCPNGATISTENETSSYVADSPVSYRVIAGLAYPFSKFSLGVGGQFVKGAVRREATNFAPLSPSAFNETSGMTLNLGVGGLVTSHLRLGVSVSNLGNRDLREIAPLTYRAGVALTTFDGVLTLHGDYIRRQRVWQEAVELVDSKITATNHATSINYAQSYENLGIASGSIQFKNIFRLLAAFAHDFSSNGERQSISAGLGLSNKGLSISYLISKPYLNREGYHHALNLALGIPQ